MPDLPKGLQGALRGQRTPPIQECGIPRPCRDANERFEVTITLRRRADGPPLPDFDYFAKTPPSQRPPMPDESFAAKYGAHTDDIKRVEEFARTHGLTVVESNSAQRTVRVAGSVEQMSRAFGVTLGRYRHTVVRQRRGKPEEEIYRGRDGFIHIPDDLEGDCPGRVWPGQSHHHQAQRRRSA